ncbi:MAG: sporulation protein [Clostridia bacterium]|nr:sporulation protein [Clostridia bacterium]MBR2132351.1 sporulation protein [Oscillospiraceae bacterium]
MERNKREKHLLSEAAELFDLPMDLLAGLPHVEVMGNRQFYMENHRGILSYSDEEIDISAESMIVRLYGKGLELVSMSGEALRIRGTICRVEWVN